MSQRAHEQWLRYYGPYNEPRRDRPVSRRTTMASSVCRCGHSIVEHDHYHCAHTGCECLGFQLDFTAEKPPPELPGEPPEFTKPKRTKKEKK